MDVYWIPFYEDVQIFLSTPFQTLPDQKISGSNRAHASTNGRETGSILARANRFHSSFALEIVLEGARILADFDLVL